MEICRAFRHRKKPEAYSLTAGVYGPAAEPVVEPAAGPSAADMPAAELVVEPSAAGRRPAVEPAAGPSAADMLPAERLAVELAAGPSAADKQPAELPDSAGRALLGSAGALIVPAGFR